MRNIRVFNVALRVRQRTTACIMTTKRNHTSMLYKMRLIMMEMKAYTTQIAWINGTKKMNEC